MNNGTMLRTCAVAATVAACAVALSGACPASAAVTYETRALTGDQAPGTSELFSLLGTPVLNNAGQIAFWGDLTNTFPRNRSGFWLGGTDSLSLVVRLGDAAPGSEPGVVFDGFRTATPTLNDAGQIVFSADVHGTHVGTSLGIWSGGTGSLSLVARTGFAAPGTGAGVVFSGASTQFNPLVFNDAGQTAFNSLIAGTGVDTTNNQGIWSEGSGSLGLVARESNAAPGTDPGVVFGGSNTSVLKEPVLNDAGQTAFRSVLTGTGVDSTNDFGIWSEGSGSLALVAREGNAAPGTTAVFSFLGTPDLNGAGQTAFRGNLTGTGVIGGNQGNFRGIWSGDTGSLSLVARMGDAAPGTDPGTVFGFVSTFGVPVLNSAGQVAFVANLTGTGSANDDSGIWLGDTGSLSLVAREGDIAPGTDLGVKFSSFDTLNDTLVLNGAGQVVFVGRLTGAGVDSTNSFGIWATDPGGVLTLVIRKGDLFDVNNDPLIDDFRTINLVNFSSNFGGEDGRGTSFNDAGQLAFKLGFTDGSSGIFVASTQAVAAPILGDLNGDGFVGIADLNIVLGNWNLSAPPGDPLADPSGDGFVGIADLNVVLGNWNAGTPPVSAAVPQPGSVWVLVLGCVAGALNRKRRYAIRS